ncbi:MAG: hypothetical protein AABZ67_09050 [Pseudomonadota bacterium]|mgnify:CR=1 FL=1
MDIFYLGLLVANIFLIVYYRLMIHYRQQGDPGRAGLAIVVSLPGKRGLESRHLKYWRNYWLAMLMMCVLVAAGLLWRYPHVAAGFRMVE